MKMISEEKKWVLYEAGAKLPLELNLSTAKLPSFVYDRRYGVFPCGFATHPSVMTLLLAWHHGYDDAYDCAEALHLCVMSETSDAFLKLEGTAYKSTQCNFVQAWSENNLNEWERRYFKNAKFIG